MLISLLDNLIKIKRRKREKGSEEEMVKGQQQKANLKKLIIPVKDYLIGLHTDS